MIQSAPYRRKYAEHVSDTLLLPNKLTMLQYCCLHNDNSSIEAVLKAGAKYIIPVDGESPFEVCHRKQNPFGKALITQYL